MEINGSYHYYVSGLVKDLCLEWSLMAKNVTARNNWNFDSSVDGEVIGDGETLLRFNKREAYLFPDSTKVIWIS